MVWLVNVFIKLTGWLPWIILAKPKIHYADKAVQRRKIKGKAIVISNHTEVWDYAALMFLFPGRILRCVVAELMYEKNPFLTMVIRGLGSIRVDRNAADFVFLGKCCNLLNRGGVVEFYPEARIQKGDLQQLLPFKPSIAYMALETSAPIIPVYTDGNYFGKGRNHIIIGKPVDVWQLYDDSRSEKENITAITEHLRGEIYALNSQLRKEIENH